MENISDLIVYVNGFQSERQPLIFDYTYLIPIVSVSLYLLMVFAGPRIMEDRKALRLRGPLQVWNLAMVLLSVAMLMGMIPNVVSFTLEKGLYQLICLPSRELYTGPQMFWVWVFAMSKFVELIDTVFLILRKRPLSFLHYYHHSTVLIYTWFSMVVQAGGVGYIFAIVNAAIHTLMYFYYFLSACGKTPSWGQFVTILQLAQMVVGIIASTSWSYFYLTGANCSCDYPREYMLSSCLLYGSYLLLFLQFYLGRYLTNKQSSAKNRV